VKFLKTNKFLTGALILAAAGILSRVIGVIFRIPLTNIVGSYGMGLYQMVFPLYALLLIVSSAGVPVAISKMIAKRREDHEYCKTVLYNAAFLLGAIGLVVSIIFAGISGLLASIQGENISIIYLAIAPSVFIVCIIAAFRGYFQGLQNMVPTAVSQIVEQVVKVTVGLTLALILIQQSVELAVFGAIVAVTISEIVALIYLWVTYRFSAKKKTTKKVKPNLDKKLMKEILLTSLPITAMATIFPLILVFDSMVIVNFLRWGGAEGREATQLFGIQSGVVHTLINLPAVIGVALATAIVPAISRLLKKQKVDEAHQKGKQAILITVAVATFFTITYLIFAPLILNILYGSTLNGEHHDIAVNLLRIESIMIIFLVLSQTFSAILQSADKSKLPLIAIAIGGGVKVIFELVFLVPVGIYAVSISNILCFAVAGSINAYFVYKHFFSRQKYQKKVIL